MCLPKWAQASFVSISTSLSHKNQRSFTNTYWCHPNFMWHGAVFGLDCFGGYEISALFKSIVLSHLDCHRMGGAKINHRWRKWGPEGQGLQGQIARLWPISYRAFSTKWRCSALVLESGDIFLLLWSLHTVDCLGLWLTEMFQGRTK